MLQALSGLLGGKQKAAPVIDVNSRAYKQFQSNVGRMLTSVEMGSRKRMQAQTRNIPQDTDWRKDPQALAHSKLGNKKKYQPMGSDIRPDYSRSSYGSESQGGMQTLRDLSPSKSYIDPRTPWTARPETRYAMQTAKDWKSNPYKGRPALSYEEAVKANPKLAGPSGAWAKVKPPTGNVSSVNSSPVVYGGYTEFSSPFSSSRWSDYSHGATAKEALRGNVSEIERRRAMERRLGKGVGFREKSRSNPGWGRSSRGWAGSGWSSGIE